MSVLNVALPPKMRPFVEQRRRHKIARGGRGSGKSWSIARALAARGVGQRTRWLCCREVQKSIKESSHRLLSDQIEALGLRSCYDIQRDVIRGPHGTEFVFAGLQDHTADSIKSYEGFDGAWVEEAHTVTENSANKLVPTIRAPGSEIWWSYNPEQSDDYVHQLAERGDSDTLVVTINYLDNPWFPAELEAERVKLLRINQDLHDHIWGGQCRSAAGLLFKRAWIKRYDALPDSLSVYMASDYAVTDEADADGRCDWTEHGVFGLDDDGDLYAVDWWSGQTSPETWIEAAVNLVRRHRPQIWFEEKGVILRAVDGALSKRLRERDVYVYREPLTSAGNKASRALGFAARASAGSVWLPKTEWADRLLNQLCAFTGEDGRTDDAVDVCSLIARGLDMMANARPKPKAEEPAKPFTKRWFDTMDRKTEAQAEERKRYYR